MLSPSRLTLATVLFGGEDVLTRTLPAWSTAIDSMDVDLRIVDNSLGRNASRLVEQHLPGAALTRRPSNPGFAASANEAVRGGRAEWVFLVNADVFLTHEAIETAIAWISADGRDPSSECAAISLVTAGTEYCGVELNAIGYFSDRPAASARPPLGPSGGALLIHRDLFNRVGGFEEDLFAWGEDAGLSLRLFAADAETHCLRLALLHTGGHSVPDRAGLRFKARLLARNRIRVMRREWSLPLQMVVGPAQLALIVANGIRKLPSGTAIQHFDGMLTALRERRTSERHPFGIREFVRYRAARYTGLG